MPEPERQRLFLRVMTGLAALMLADGVIEFCLSGAVHQLTLAIVMSVLIGKIRWWALRQKPEAGRSFIPPQSESV